MIPIRSLTSDLDYEHEFVKNIKRRIIEQKFLYADTNAYGHYATEHTADDFSTEEFVSFIESYFPTDGKSVIVSLGGGNAAKEKEVLIHMKEKGKKVKLIVVDSSKQMLEFAYKNLKEFEGDFELIHSDITSSIFQNEIQHLTQGFDFKVYALLGGTMGNMVQTEIVDTLYNITTKGALVWIDVLATPGKARLDQLKLFKDYVKRLGNPEELEFYFYPLKQIGVTLDYGVMQLQSVTEDSIGVQKFRYSFSFTKPMTIVHRGQKIHFLPPENVKLMDIRVYHAKTMVNFFERHGMTLLKEVYKNKNAQFLFEHA